MRTKRKIRFLSKKIKDLNKERKVKLSSNEKKLVKDFFKKYIEIKNLDWHEYYKNYLEFNKKMFQKIFFILKYFHI